MPFRDVIENLSWPHGRSQNQPDTSTTLPLSQPSTDPIMAVRLPCNRTLMNQTSRVIITLIDSRISDKVLYPNESILGCIPDLQTYEQQKTFSWAHRQISTIPYDGGYYLLYMCLDEADGPEIGLPENQTLNKCPDWSIDWADEKVYGDAFVFKIECTAAETEWTWQRAKYVDMEQDFLGRNRLRRRKIGLPGRKILGEFCVEQVEEAEEAEEAEQDE